MVQEDGDYELLLRYLAKGGPKSVAEAISYRRLADKYDVEQIKQKEAKAIALLRELRLEAQRLRGVYREAEKWAQKDPTMEDEEYWSDS